MGIFRRNGGNELTYVLIACIVIVTLMLVGLILYIGYILYKAHKKSRSMINF